MVYDHDKDYQPSEEARKDLNGTNEEHLLGQYQIFANQS